jgi:type II secretory pathway component PulF
VRLSLRDKEIFYDELGQLLRSGTPFPRAVTMLGGHSRGSLRKLLDNLRAATDRGETVSGAFAAQQPAIGEMEVSVMTACDRSGRLDEGCRMLSAYFGTLRRARATVLTRLAYPAFVLHFGVFATALPALFTGGGAAAYFKQTLGFLLVLYACLATLALAVRALHRLGQVDAWTDSVLMAIPIFGGLRRMFALARFCATYDMQLESGINVMDSLTTAARASQSALIIDAAKRALPGLRTGSQVAPLLARCRVFPEEMTRAMHVGEETGELDRELKRLTESFERDALRRVEIISDWLPKLIYLLVAGYVGWQIISFYTNYYGGMLRSLDVPE